MNIGVALSGCSIGGVSAYGVLRLLREMGIKISIVSACGIPAAAALAYTAVDRYDTGLLMCGEFYGELSRGNPEQAAADLASGLEPKRKLRLPLAVAAVNIPDGKMAVFTNDFSLQSERLATFPLLSPRDALGAAIGAAEGSKGYLYRGMRLCDFSARYGCPVHPLRLKGMNRTLSFSFLPKTPRTSHEMAVCQMIKSTASAADLHIPVEFDSPQGWESCLEQAQELTLKKQELICQSVLF